MPIGTTTRAVLCGAVLVLATAACTAAPASEPTPSATSSTPTPTPTPDDARAQAAVVAVFDDYLAAVVLMENTAEADPAPLLGLVGEEVLDAQVKRVAKMANQGIHRDGEPVVGDPVVTVDGDTARLEVCVDQDEWVAVYGDERLGSDYGTIPTGYDLELVDDAWTVVAKVPEDEVSLTC